MELEDDKRYTLSDENYRKAQHQTGCLHHLLKSSGLFLASFFVVLYVVCVFLDVVVDGNPFPREQIVPTLILIAIFGICAWTWWRLNKNFDRGEIFTEGNAKILSGAGTWIQFCGVWLIILEFAGNPYFVLLVGLPLMLGCVFDLVGYMIRRGIKLQKEQELTV